MAALVMKQKIKIFHRDKEIYKYMKKLIILVSGN